MPRVSWLLSVPVMVPEPKVGGSHGKKLSMEQQKPTALSREARNVTWASFLLRATALISQMEIQKWTSQRCGRTNARTVHAIVPGPGIWSRKLVPAF